MPANINASNPEFDVVRQILLAMRRYELKWQRHDLLSKAELAKMEKDSLDLSEGVKVRKAADPAAKTGSDDNINIRIADLIKKLQALRDSSASGGAGTQAIEIDFQQEVHTDISVSLEIYEPVEGLVVRSRNLAETDLYKFEFIDGATFRITDKSTGKSTTIWGDPHIDTSDEPGAHNGDFKDLTASNTHTTFILRDNTRVTFTARDEGLIAKVDIFKGDQHLSGIGAEHVDFDPQTGLFAAEVDESASSHLSSVPVGDVVYAGGDGNDWYNAARQLVWGKTSGPLAGERPDFLYQYYFNQTISRQVSVNMINTMINTTV
jgi:hypothetical protein